MPKYKWANPHEWLMDKAADMNEQELFQVVHSLAGRLDADSIQDLFQGEMSLDGYFDEQTKENEQ